MQESELNTMLAGVNHSEPVRTKYCAIIISQPESLEQLIDIACNPQEKYAVQAAWLMEFVARNNLELLLPFLNKFTANIQKIRSVSGMRPVAKICEYLILEFYKKRSSTVRAALNKKQRQRIAELCFDYLISDIPVAPRVYSMTCLFHLGTEFDWIHDELVAIIDREYSSSKPSFQARSRQILRDLKKL